MSGKGPTAPNSAPEGAGRVLRLCWILPQPRLSGGIRTTRELAEAMAERGHDVTIAFPSWRRAWPAPWRVRSLARTLRSAWREWGRQRHHLAGATVRLIEVAGEEVRAADVPDADVVIGTWWRTMEWIRDWPPSKGLKAYYIQHYELHAGDPERVRETYRQPSIKFAVSSWLTRLMEEEFGDPNSVVIPNGVDRRVFDASRRGKAGVPTVGFMYARRSWKGVDTAVQALRLAQAEQPGLRVLSFGSEVPRRSEIGLEGFEFFHRPAQSEIAAIYRSCDCWILPSETEGFGLPGLEAAACRCPVVATRCGGPEDYVRDGVSGFLVPVRNPEEMARRVLEIVGLSEREWLAMSDASYAVLEDFDWAVSAQRLERLLIDAVEHQEKVVLT
jgi:glycosyltransferase involved in cell wall biosynthesis